MGVNSVDYEPQGTEVIQSTYQLLPSGWLDGWQHQNNSSSSISETIQTSLRYGRMVKALACRVEGPGFELTKGKVLEKVSVKKVSVKKKKKGQLSSACMMEVQMTGVLPYL